MFDIVVLFFVVRLEPTWQIGIIFSQEQPRGDYFQDAVNFILQFFSQQFDFFSFFVIIPWPLKEVR